MAQDATRPNEMKIVYDCESDVLYVTLGSPEYTDYVEHSEDVIRHLDPDTKPLGRNHNHRFFTILRESKSQSIYQEVAMSENRRHILGLSGGKDSSALAIYMRNEGAGDGVRLLRHRKRTAGDV